MKPRFMRPLSLLMVLVILVNLLPMGVFAEEFRESLEADTEAVLQPSVETSAQIVGEVSAKRTQYTKEFLLSNGLHLAAVYPDAVHYQKDGSWEEIDNTLTLGKDGTYGNTAGVWNVRFPGQLSRENSVSIEKDGYTLSFAMAGELRSSGELMTAAIGAETTAEPDAIVSPMQLSTASVQPVDAAALQAGYQYPEMAPDKLYSRLTYAGVYENTNITYDLDGTSVKESIILSTYSSTLRGYRYTLSTGEMIPVLQEDGEILLYAPDKETVVMIMPAPFLLDANNAYNEDVQVQLTGEKGTYTLTYLLPRQWLAAEDRAWPVILDPVITSSRDNLGMEDRTVCSKATMSATKTTLDAGYSTERGKMRAYFRYTQLPPLTASDVIVDASFTLTKVQNSEVSKTVEVHKVTELWDHNTITWDNQPDFEADISDFTHVRYAGEHHWRVTEIVRSWYTENNYGLMVKMSNSVETGTANLFRQFYSSDTAGSLNRPILQIVFRNNNGLEGYWDYTTTGAGRAGTGYVNNFTGNLTWVHNDIGFGGNRMPVSIQHVYNVNDAIVPVEAEGEENNANDSGGNYFGLGIGWRTNYHERVFLWECDDVYDDPTVDIDYYIWEDGDGTDHYFKKSSAYTYKDEDGLQLKLTTNGSGTGKYKITDKKGNTSYFDTNGRLTKLENKQQTKSSITITYAATTGYEIDCITDGAGRKYDFGYSSDGMLISIAYTGKGAEELYKIEFGYDGNNLTEIKDNDGAECYYTYNDDGILLTAQDIDGYKVSYTYTAESVTASATGTNGAPWSPPYLVKTIAATDDGVAGGSLEFTYGYNETRLKDHNGNVEILQFNDFGNMVAIMDDEGHAQYAKYAANTASDTGKANQLNLNSKLQNTVGNMLNDSSFEKGTLWTDASGSTGTCEISTAHSYYGAKSLNVLRDGFGPAFTVAPGATYTFSAYIKTLGDPAMIGISVGGQNQAQKEISVNSDWARYEVSYTNNSANAVQAKPHIATMDDVGAWVDCVQLENTPTASRYNLVENGDFRFSQNDSTWTKSSDCTANDTFVYCDPDDPDSLKPATGQLDSTYFSITGNRTKTKNISQTVKISGSKDDSFVLGGWVHGYAVPQNGFDSNTRRFALRARFKYTDGKYSDYFYANFQPGVHGWQYSAVAMAPKKDYTEITVAAVYHYNVNTIYLDGIQLFKEEFGTSYTYDDETGDVISVVDLQKKNTTYEYNTSGDLTEILENGKSKMKYTYDSHHNVKTATTNLGVKQSFTYDPYGNNTSVTIENGTKKLTSEASYTDSGNLLDYTKDALGKVTKYGYDPDTNVLKWVQYPNDTDGTEGTADTRTNYTYDNMYRTATAACTTDTGANMSAVYYYTDDYLTTVVTPTTAYNFTYGDFGLRQSVKVGVRTLASYEYTEDQNKYLQALDYRNGDSVEYTYDNKGRMLTQTYEDGDTVSYAYDNNGALATVTDSATGITTTYYYDLIDRMMKYVESGTDYSHSVGYEYDEKNNLSEQVEVINGTTHTTAYTYDNDNRVKTVTVDGSTITYTYDGYSRLTKQETKKGETTVLTEEYTFTETTINGTAVTSSQIATYKVTSGGQTTIYTYTYDDNGNILSVSDGTKTTSYVYDSANQLIRENNQAGNFTHTWTYDAAGNILNRKEYAYTTGTLGTPTKTVTYGYGDILWGDLLKTYDGKTISYDAIGNPTSDGTLSYTWEHGRQLASVSKGSNTWEYTYNADGMRIKKALVGGTAPTSYVYNGSQLVRMQSGSQTLDFTYDPSGQPFTLTYNGTTYYYVTNVQGDVIGIRDANGTLKVTYTYDAWGNVLSKTGDAYLQTLNPLLYRGYVYDQETGLYYLQSRYYNPKVGRFINADGQMSDVGGDILGYNMFAYCMNNPVNMSDPDGNWPTWNDVISAVKRAVDTIVHNVVMICNPVSMVGVALHYSRNLLNNDSYSEEELIEKGYTHEDEKSDKFHQNKQRNNARNRKYVIGEWFSSEVVYYSDGTLNNEPEDRGTFNVYSGSDPIKNVVIHGVFDVIPYMVWGNSLDDSTTIIDRVIMIWR